MAVVRADGGQGGAAPGALWHTAGLGWGFGKAGAVFPGGGLCKETMERLKIPSPLSFPMLTLSHIVCLHLCKAYGSASVYKI